MPFIGVQPAETALTTGNLADDIVTEAKMANDAIGLTELKAGTDGEIISWDASGNPVAIGAGSAGEFLKSQGAGSVPVFAAGGKIIQVVNTQNSASATGTTVMVPDDSIPQNTEGVAFTALDTAITPTNSSNKLLIQVTAFCSNSYAGSELMMALFQDSTSGALASCSTGNNTATTRHHNVIQYYMAAGTTSATTFKVRIGGNNSGTTTINGSDGARDQGGVANSSMIIWEIGA